MLNPKEELAIVVRLMFNGVAQQNFPRQPLGE